MPAVVKPVIAIPALPPLGRTLLAEFIGTYVLVYVITQVNDIYHASNLAGLAIGLTLTSLVFSLAHHNSGVFNPAVGLALYLLGFMDTREFFLQFLSQILGGLAAGLTTLAFIGGGGYPVCAPAETTSAGIGKAFVAEFIGTAILAMTVTQVAASKQRENHFFGLAIGLTVLGQAISIGKWSGGSLNPAVTTGLQLVKCIGGECEHMKFLPLYFLAEFLGSVFAFVFFSLTGSYAEGEGTHDATFDKDSRTNEAYSRISTANNYHDNNSNRNIRQSAENNNNNEESNYSLASRVPMGDRKNVTASENEPLIK